MKGRVCKICVPCIAKRDARDLLLDKDFSKYVGPQDRPGHRLYERRAKGRARSTKPLSAAQLAARAAFASRQKARSSERKGLKDQRSQPR